MTRRLLAIFALGLLILIGCADQPSRFHNHGTPGLKHYTPKPQTFTVDTDKGNDFTVQSQPDGSFRLIQRGSKSLAVLSPDTPVKNPASKTKPLGNMDITPDEVGHPEWDPKTQAFPKESNIRFEEPPRKGRNYKPVNGQCPVCGTMAEPYTPSLSDPPYNDMKCGPSPGDSNTSLSICTPVTESILPTSRRIDCAHCNNTFRQWAGGREPKR